MHSASAIARIFFIVFTPFYFIAPVAGYVYSLVFLHKKVNLIFA